MCLTESRRNMLLHTFREALERPTNTHDLTAACNVINDRLFEVVDRTAFIRQFNADLVVKTHWGSLVDSNLELSR